MMPVIVTPSPPPPPPGLAAAVRSGRWAEVRTISENAAKPLSPAVVLVIARAMRLEGEPQKAFDFLIQTLPRAGDVAPALRLEAARCRLALGRDPYLVLQTILTRPNGSGLRKKATGIVREAWEKLPLAGLQLAPQTRLLRHLRREQLAIRAMRTDNSSAALQILRDGEVDGVAFHTAGWLESKTNLTLNDRILVGRVLLNGGAWREARTYLDQIPIPPENTLQSELLYLRGRASYRLGDFANATACYEKAFVLATTDQQRFAASVQRARVAEISDDFATAFTNWETARKTGLKEIEGWDGGARALLALGKYPEALALMTKAPMPVLRVAGTRLVAGLLARNQTALAGALLAELPATSPSMRLLRVIWLQQSGQHDAANRESAAFLADPRGGAWREYLAESLPADDGVALESIIASRNPTELSTVAVLRGPAAARYAFLQALAADPEWARLLAGAIVEPPTWGGAPRQLAEVGLEEEAARLFAYQFPDSTPNDLAWTTRTLAQWGNGPAALDYGERLWGRLGGVPAIFIPENISRQILPPDLIGVCVISAAESRLPSSWMVGIIRQESRFDAEVRSTAGALGIAQLIPELITRLGGTHDDAKNPERAARLAAKEITRLAGHYDGCLSLTAAGYNAGDAVVTSWLAALGGDVPEPLFAAMIPYRETAGYVLAVREGAALSGGLRSEIAKGCRCGVTKPVTARTGSVGPQDRPNSS